MAQTSYTGSSGSTIGLNQNPSISVSGGSGVQGIVQSVNVRVPHSFRYYRTCTAYVTVNTSYGSVDSSQSSFSASNDSQAALTYCDYTVSGMTVNQANSITSITVHYVGGTASSSEVYVKKDYTATVTVNYVLPTKIGTPTVSVENTKATGGTLLVWWNEGYSDYTNSPVSNWVEMATSTNGASFSNWDLIGNYVEPTSAIYATLPAPKCYVKFRVRTLGSAGSEYYSDYGESATVLVAAAPTAPQNLTATPEKWEEGNVTLAWEGSTVSGATISAYYIQYRLKPYGGSLGDWTALANTTSLTYSYNPNLDKGDQVEYRVYAQSSDTINSAYSNTATVERETDKPYGLTPEEGWYVDIIYYGHWWTPESLQTEGYSYQVRYTTDSGATWSEWGTDLITGINIALGSVWPNVAESDYLQYDVRVKQQNGDVSDYARSGRFYKNTVPDQPTILAPANISSSPCGDCYLVVSVQADPNGHKTRIEYAVGSASEEYTILRDDIAGAGVFAFKITNPNSTVKVRVSDEYDASSLPVTLSILRTPEIFTDDPIVPGTTRIKAQHINELRSNFSNNRSYYGVQYEPYSEGVIAGTTSIKNFPTHILELRTRIEAIYNKINSLGAGTVVELPQWAAPLDDLQPTAAAINELRAAIKAI